MNAITMPALIPESAPFSSEQRAWLNGFFAAIMGAGDGEPAAAAAPAQPPAPEEDFPWHDAALLLDERMALAAGRAPERQLMAAMAQLDCGQCGYLCQTYAEAVWNGAEVSLSRCVPGGKETSRKLKALMTDLASHRTAAPAATPGLSIVPSSAVDTRPGFHRDRPALATLIEAHPLSRKGSAKDVRHVVLDLSATAITYKVGDSLGVFPRKNPLLVQAVLDRLGATGEEMVGFQGEALPLRQILLSRADIARPSDAAIEFLAQRATEGSEALALLDIAAGKAPPELADADLLDLLQAFPSVRPSLTGLLGALERLQPRLYSIASSPKAHPGEVHLTVSAVRWTSGERSRSGVGSCYLADVATAGDVIPVFIQPSHGFGLPPDPATPAIMIGPGTGIAPFRAFLEEREATGAPGRNWLFFGDQHRSSDFLYEDQVTDWQRRGLLTRLDLAFSRDQADKLYVQHLMRASGTELWRWLQDGAHVYVCGDAMRMAADVQQALLAIAGEHGGLAPDAAKAWLDGLTRADRYQRDVY